MNKKIAEEIRELAKRYHTPDFITRDPIQFPHHFTEKRILKYQPSSQPGLLSENGNVLSGN